VPRPLDVLIAGAALVALSPVLLLAALLVLLLSGRPVLYRQERVGKDGEVFTLLKLRTMRAVPGTQLTVGTDARVTRIGAHLRARRIDELPQLVNVLRGDMSLVGARPEVPEFVLSTLPDQAEVLRHRPGITDPASLAFRDEADLLAGQPDPVGYYRSTLLPAKVAVSAAYLRRRTALTDLQVLLQTAGCLLGLGHPDVANRDLRVHPQL
jgi:lipopolysaccharide/colanic/teichoic acid biosynthesis glycosyltransferase